jgi:hypothetical protein
VGGGSAVKLKIIDWLVLIVIGGMSLTGGVVTVFLGVIAASVYLGVRYLYASKASVAVVSLEEQKQVVIKFLNQEFPDSDAGVFLGAIDIPSMYGAIKSGDRNAIQAEYKKIRARLGQQTTQVIEEREAIFYKSASKIVPGAKDGILKVVEVYLNEAQSDGERRAMQEVRDEVLAEIGNDMTMGRVRQVMSKIRNQTCKFPIGTRVQVQNRTYGIVTDTTDEPEHSERTLYKVNGLWENEGDLALGE